ncbi:MAG: sterol desaturase family protein [Pseudomonadota bacterium]|nr:MAG: sterol desaturase family protein [Pseudomonadota bacterium]
MSISEFVMANEPAIRMGFFLGILGVMAVWEIATPRRALTISKTVRWVNNLGIVFLNSFLLRLIFPAAAVGMATFAAGQGWGILNYFDVPFWLAVPVSVVAMDFVIYLQHVMVHAVPALWRLHRMHHADLDFDVTTGARFHPLEIILSMLIKFATIVVLGPPVLAVVIFEVILNATAMFNHGNVRIPREIDRVLRLIVVTPDMHRVHHSVEDDEANSNFGFSLPWWDRLFGTYRDQPRAGHEAMSIGIHKFREPRQVAWLPGMLALPFIGKITGYAINRREWSQPSEE